MNDGQFDIGQIADIIKGLGGSGVGSPSGTRGTEFGGFHAGDIRPKRKPIYKSPPVLTLKKVIGLSSGNTNFYATFKFYIQKPTLENPTTAVKLALQGAKGASVFTMLDISEVSELMSYFKKCATEGAKVVDAYKKLEEELQEKRSQIEKDEQHIVHQYAPEIAEVLDKADIGD